MENKNLFELAIKSVEDHAWNSGNDASSFLASLIKLHGCKDVIEVGVFKGLCSCHMIDAIPENGSFIGIDIEDYRPQGVKDYYDSRNAKFIKKDSITALGELSSHKVDLVFIDSYHVYDQVRAEFKLSEKIMRQGGLICMHDYYVSAGVAAWIEEIRKYNWLEVVTLKTPNNAGMTIVRCRL